MEVVLSDRSFSIKNLTFNLVPRLEGITNSIGAQNDIYEILTSVYLLVRSEEVRGGEECCGWGDIWGGWDRHK